MQFTIFVLAVFVFVGGVDAKGRKSSPAGGGDSYASPAGGGGTYGTGSKSSSTYVRGHVTKSGTYVSPHRKTAPDVTQRNNYSASGNVNPYTGKVGTRQPKR